MNIRRPIPFVLLASIMVLVMVFGAVAPPVVLADPTVASCAPDSGTASISGTVTGPGATPQQYVQVTAYTAYGKQVGG
ncbi:MAG TPA: hypothetical protein VFT99_07410, partial [Roseiflexaceae bacterium]|nr:hypothetical protein [Roseiflexaceae bacterium]